MNTLKTAQVEGKRAIVRADFNVPTDKQGNITDDFRITETIPTIKFLLKKGATQVILMSHFGRPDGKVVESMRLDAIGKRLSEKLKKPVAKLPDCIDVTIPPDKIVLLENLRFHAEEEKDDEAFAKKLASHADIYVNEAFSVSHRAHASVHAITKLLPSYAGFLLEREATNLGKVTYDVKKPFVAIIGGAKEDKIEVINALLPKVDTLIIGGMLANTFLKAKGYDLGASKFTPELIETAKGIIEKAGDKLVLPTDLVFADRFEKGATVRTAAVESTDVAGLIGVDIGTQTVVEYAAILKKAKTIFWAGPIGVFEIPEFALGSIKISALLAGMRSTRVIGGGDSAAAVAKAGFSDLMTFMSTAGGASLEFVAGKRLPGLEAVGYYEKQA